jgi:putative transcriptional regulator
LSDPNFFKSVVLMVQHDSEGAFGLILNRPTARSVSELWELLFDDLCDSTRRVYHGGPVEGALTALHSGARCAEREIVPGVFFSASQEDLSELVQEDDDMLRVFIGYAGWAAGQLESEMDQGGWLSFVAARDTIFGDQDAMWKHIVEEIGRNILAPSIKAKHIPQDPGAN